MPRTQPGPRGDRPRAEDGNPPGAWRGRLRLWIDIKGRGTLGPGKLRLLDAIATTKSLSAAAKQLRMSYRLAWERLRLIEERTGIIVVEPHRGGRSGGGTELTVQGHALLEAYRTLQAEMEEHMQSAFRRHFASWSTPQRAKLSGRRAPK
jgi:molybdate transport system regulatory protein